MLSKLADGPSSSPRSSKQRVPLSEPKEKEKMNKPRLICYNDAHHFNAKRIDPPTSIHKLQWPVDEVLGTGVDLLVLGLGYGDVYFHQSKIGRTVGEKKEVWEEFIDWRIMRMVRDAKEMGTDQVREIIKRGREKGLPVFPSLKLQDMSEPGGERCGWLKWEHGRAVCLGQKDERDARWEWCYDFSNELVRQEKLSLIREMLDDYQADGMELDFMFFPAYFRNAEVEKNIPLMNQFVAQVKELANEVGRKQGRTIPICARVHYRREENLRIGLDVETWLKDKNIDYVVGQVRDVLFDTGLQAHWLADTANAAGVAAYIRPPLAVYDERTGFPSIEMYRALGQTLLRQGFAGMFLGYLSWPFSEREYQILREVAHPESNGRRDKRYLLQPRELGTGFAEPPQRQLPLALGEGETAKVTILVSDDLESARKDGEMRKPVLTIRFSFFCVEDEVEFRFNGQVLPLEEAEVTDERALRIPLQQRPIDAPLSFSAHWFRWRLDIDLLKPGENTLEVEVKRFEKTAGFTRSINGVEIQTRYKDFVRPEGIEGVSRLRPLGV